MRLRILALGAGLAAAHAASAQSIQGGPYFNPANSHWYYRLFPSTWAEAEADAQIFGGHLATIESAAENDWIRDNVLDPAGTLGWIGLNRAGNAPQFTWSSGSAASYRNWAPGEPNNYENLGEYFVDMIPDGTWNDHYENPGSTGLVEVESAVGYVVVNRAVEVSGLPCPDQFLQSESFGTYNTAASVICPPSGTGVASISSAIRPDGFSWQGQLSGTLGGPGVARGRSEIHVTFNVAKTVSYTLTGTGWNPGAPVTGSLVRQVDDYSIIDLPAQLGTGTVSGTLEPAQYTLHAAIDGTAAAGDSASINFTVQLQPPGPFSIDWYTIDCGGGQVGGGPFSIAYTIGQHDARLGLAGGDFQLSAGYWPAFRQCICDLNSDGFVDDADFQIFVSSYNALLCTDPSVPPNCPSDFNRDDLVDDADFQIFVAAYNALLCP